jgi:hypothetical protein
VRAAVAAALPRPHALPASLVHLSVPLLLIPAAAAAEVAALWEEIWREAVGRVGGHELSLTAIGGSDAPVPAGLSAAAATLMAAAWRTDFQPLLDDLAFLAEVAVGMAATRAALAGAGAAGV